MATTRIPFRVGETTVWATLIWNTRAGSPDDPVRIIEAMLERARHPNAVFKEYGTILRERLFRNFQQGGDPPWEPLKPATIAGKIRFLKKQPQRTRSGMRPFRLKQGNARGGTRQAAHRILILTGELRDSWVQAGARGHYEDVQNDGQMPTFSMGSQLTITSKPARGKRGVRKKKTVRELSRAAQGMGGGHTVNLARIHDQGEPAAHIPPRPQFPGGVVKPEDMSAIQKATRDYILGSVVQSGG
jgi:phage gpG-like protein